MTGAAPAWQPLERLQRSLVALEQPGNSFRSRVTLCRFAPDRQGRDELGILCSILFQP
jgi:hypothetical protein